MSEEKVSTDLRKFFDTVGHEHIRELLGHRVQDGVITRFIGKWQKAGAWEDGKVSHPQEGTPQGGVVSPILSNNAPFLSAFLDNLATTRSAAETCA